MRDAQVTEEDPWTSAANPLAGGREAAVKRSVLTSFSQNDFEVPSVSEVQTWIRAAIPADRLSRNPGSFAPRRTRIWKQKLLEALWCQAQRRPEISATFLG